MVTLKRVVKLDTSVLDFDNVAFQQDSDCSVYGMGDRLSVADSINIQCCICTWFLAFEWTGVVLLVAS